MADLELTGSLGMKSGLTKPLIEDSRLIKGSPVSIATLTDLSTIPSYSREEGQSVYVRDTKKKYKFDGGIADGNLVEDSGVDEATVNTLISSNTTVTSKADVTALNTEKARIDTLVTTAPTSFYEECLSTDTGALEVVASGAITGQIDLANVTPVATGYTPTAGDYVRLVYGLASGSIEVIDARVGADGKTYSTAGDAVREQIKGVNQDISKINNVYTKTGEPLIFKFEQGLLDADEIETSSTKTIHSNRVDIIENGRYTLNYNDAAGYKIKVLRTVNSLPATPVFTSTSNGQTITFYNTNDKGYTRLLVNKYDSEDVIQDLSPEDISDLNLTLKYVSEDNSIFEARQSGDKVYQLDVKTGDRLRFVVTRDSASTQLLVRLSTDVTYSASSTNNIDVKAWSRQDCIEEFIADKDYKIMYINFGGAGFIKVEKIPELEDTIKFYAGKKAKKEEVLGYTFAQVTMDGAGEFASSPNSIGTTLHVIPGDRYRFSVNDGYVLCFNYFVPEESMRKTFKFHTRMMEVIFDESEVKVCVQKRDFAEVPLVNVEDAGFKVEHVIWRNRSGLYDMVIAAYNSTDYEKEQADIVCNGTNDEIVLECAANCNVTLGGNSRVLLMPGDYMIDAFRPVYEGTYVGRGHNAICVYPSIREVNTYTARFDGRYSEYSNLSSDTRILVSDTCYNAINPTKADEYAIIGALRRGSTNMGIKYLLMGLEMANIYVSPNGLEKPICCIDGIGFGVLGLENISITKSIINNDDRFIKFDTVTIADGLIGIRGVCGSNRGVRNYIKGCKVAGMYEGLAVLGEHFIIQDTLMHSCIIGFTIGNYDVREKMEHPNIFIGCSVEQCKRFGILNRYGATEESVSDAPSQTIVWIGGSTENTYSYSDETVFNMDRIKEIVKGSYSGRFETDFGDYSLFEEDGSGKNIQWINTLKNYKDIGTTTERPTYCRDGYRYYDTTLSCEIIRYDGNWVKALDGSIV